MEIKHSMDFSKKHTFKTIILGVLLGVWGLFVVLKIDGLEWLIGLSLTKLAMYIFLALLPGIYVHEAYHQLIAKMLGHTSSSKGLLLPAFPSLDNLKKWEALSIKLAPSFDLSLIAGLVIAFLPGPFNPILSIFLVGNLAGSANDLIQSFYIFKLASRDSVIRLTSEGFEIRE